MHGWRPTVILRLLTAWHASTMSAYTTCHEQLNLEPLYISHTNRRFAIFYKPHGHLAFPIGRVFLSQFCTTLSSGGSRGGVATPPLNCQKRAVSSMAVVMDLVVTSYSPDFLSEGPFQHCPLEHQHVVCTGWTGTVQWHRRATSVRSCS